MGSRKITLEFAAAAALAAAGCASSGDAKDGAGATASAPAAAPAVVPAATPAVDPAWAAKTFERMCSLQGTWDPTPGSKMQAAGGIRYHVLGNGSVVLETLFAGSPHEMATMYHMDRGALVATHYCAAGNQPSYRAEPTSNPDQVRWAFTGLSNGDAAADMHMHEGLTTFSGADHLNQKWYGWNKGAADPEHVAEFDLARAK